jgi:hypothetical protein
LAFIEVTFGPIQTGAGGAAASPPATGQLVRAQGHAAGDQRFLHTLDPGEAAGAICGCAGTSDVIDALVVTSDPQDLQHLASSLRSKLTLYTV